MDDDVWELVERSRWQLQLVTVPKPDGSPRFTTDMSPLNQHVFPVHYPLLVIKDLFLKLWGAHFFSKLNQQKGCYHIQPDESSREYTTMLTHQGLFCYKRLLMGLTDSASVFQQLVSQKLAGCKGAMT